METTRPHIRSIDPAHWVGQHILVVQTRVDFGSELPQIDDQCMFTGRFMSQDGYMYHYTGADWQPIVEQRSVDAERALEAHIVAP